LTEWDTTTVDNAQEEVGIKGTSKGEVDTKGVTREEDNSREEGTPKQGDNPEGVQPSNRVQGRPLRE
jgi:hypothetical protein